MVCGAAVGQDNPHFCHFYACGCFYLSAHMGLSSPSCISRGIGFQLAASGSGCLQQVEQLWEGDGSVQGILRQSVSDVRWGLTQCRFTASFLYSWQGQPSSCWAPLPTVTLTSSGHGTKRWARAAATEAACAQPPETLAFLRVLLALASSRFI